MVSCFLMHLMIFECELMLFVIPLWELFKAHLVWVYLFSERIYICFLLALKTLSDHVHIKSEVSTHDFLGCVTPDMTTIVTINTQERILKSCPTTIAERDSFFVLCSCEDNFISHFTLFWGSRLFLGLCVCFRCDECLLIRFPFKWCTRPLCPYIRLFKQKAGHLCQ